jgi:hypothetical protein
LAQHYSQFTAEERLRLVLAAKARGDVDEIARLLDSSPPDPEYSKLLDRLGYAVIETVMCWLDVSHYVIRTRLAANAFKLFASDCEPEFVFNSRSRTSAAKKLEALSRKYVARGAEAEAICKTWSAQWKGIESAITKFCEEIGLPRNHLLAVMNSLPVAIEDARPNLDPDVPADRDWEEKIYGWFRRAWSGQEESKRQNDLRIAVAGSPEADKS